MATLTVGSSGTYATINAAMVDASAGDTIHLQAGYSNESANITHENITVTGDASSQGIVLTMAPGIDALTLGGDAPINVFDNAGDNTITGNSGANVITVTGGADVVDGGAGSDRLVIDYHTATTTVSGTATNFSVDGGSSVSLTSIENITVHSGSGIDTITTGAGNDVINAGEGASTIDAGDGANLVITGSGVDTIITGSGNDTILAGDGASTIVAGDGANLVITGSGIDTITTGSGNDTIEAGDGASTIVAGAGNNVITNGSGVDTISFLDGNNNINVGAGASTITGGNGNNIITGGLESGIGTIALGTGNNIIHMGDGANTITAGPTGTGNNSVTTGSGADTITLGGGNNEICAGDGANTITAGPTGSGNNTVHTGNGADTITVGNGNNIISAGDGANTITAGSGDNIIHTGSGIDTITAMGGNNNIEAGDGANTITTGDGNDTVHGGDGIDTITTGAGSDYIYADTGGADIIDAGESPGDNDVLDLGYLNGNYTIHYSANPEDGTIDRLDAAGNVLSSFSFAGIEHIVSTHPVPMPDPITPCIVPCFTTGALIQTAGGLRPIEAIRPGDSVMTRDNGLREVVWIGARTVSAGEMATNASLRPVLIRKDALGPGIPSRDTMVSRQHRMLVAGPRAALYFGEDEVLVRACHLIGRPGIVESLVPQVTFIHMLFDRHEVVSGDGAWSESFQPGVRTLTGMDAATRAEVFQLFPDLVAPTGTDAFVDVRLTLRGYEAKVLYAQTA